MTAVILVAAACGTGTGAQTDQAQADAGASDSVGHVDAEPAFIETEDGTIIIGDVETEVPGDDDTSVFDDPPDALAAVIEALPPVVDPDAPDWDVEPLGMPMVGAGELVRLTDPDGPIDDEAECSTGWLGMRWEDGSIHRYDDLGLVGNLALHNGPRGQDALVATCEEGVVGVWIQGSAVVPVDGIPVFEPFPVGSSYAFDLGSDLSWRGDLFSGYGSRNGVDELVVFDTATGRVTEAASLLGIRLDRVVHGFDVVLPVGWAIEAEDIETGRLELASADGLARVVIEPVDVALDLEVPESAELIRFYEDEVPLWASVEGTNGARRSGLRIRPTWLLETGDGLRTVHHIEGGQAEIIVDVYVADVVAQIQGSAADAVVDQFRVYG